MAYDDSYQLCSYYQKSQLLPYTDVHLYSHATDFVYLVYKNIPPFVIPHEAHAIFLPSERCAERVKRLSSCVYVYVCMYVIKKYGCLQSYRSKIATE